MASVRSESQRTRCDTIIFMFLQRDGRLDKDSSWLEGTRPSVSAPTLLDASRYVFKLEAHR